MQHLGELVGGEGGEVAIEVACERDLSETPDKGKIIAVMADREYMLLDDLEEFFEQGDGDDAAAIRVSPILGVVDVTEGLEKVALMRHTRPAGDGQQHDGQPEEPPLKDRFDDGAQSGEVGRVADLPVLADVLGLPKERWGGDQLHEAPMQL